MNYSKETKRFARTLVIAYGKYIKSERTYELDSNAIPQFDVNNLVGFMMKDDPSMVNEANGLDNPYYETIMRPALLKSMLDLSLESKLNLASEWRKGICGYFKKDMEHLLADVLEDYNFEFKTINAA